MAELTYSSNGKNRSGNFVCQYRRWTGNRWVYFTIYSPQPCGATYGAQLDAVENFSSDIPNQQQSPRGKRVSRRLTRNTNNLIR